MVDETSIEDLWNKDLSIAQQLLKDSGSGSSLCQCPPTVSHIQRADCSEVHPLVFAAELQDALRVGAFRLAVDEFVGKFVHSNLNLSTRHFLQRSRLLLHVQCVECADSRSKQQLERPRDLRAHR